MASLLAKLFAVAPRSSPSYSPGDGALAALFNSEPSAAGIDVDEFKSLNYAAFWFGVRLISEAVASLPCIYYERLAGGGKKRASDEELYEIVHDTPNEEMTSMVYRETSQAHVVTWGNCYSEIERYGDGRPKALWPLTPNSVQVDRDKAGRIVYSTAGNSTSIPVPADRMLHVPGLGFDGLQGYSVVAKARQAIGLGLATERFGGTFFGNNARPSGILKHELSPKPEVRAEMRESWTREHGGPNTNRVGVLWGGWTWQDVGMSPEDSQFLETREFQRAEIGLWLNIPPFKMWVTKAATYASAEQFAIDFVVHTIRPWLVRWEGEYRRKLLDEKQRKRFFIEHLVDGLLRGDQATRTASLATQFQNGAINLDDWNEIENRNPLPNGAGKVHFVPLNMVPIEKAINPPEPPPAAPAKLEPTPGPEKPPVPAPAKPAAPPAATLLAARAVWVDAVGRLLHKEAKAARQAAATPANFLTWMDAFYADHLLYVEATIRPAQLLTCGYLSPPGCHHQDIAKRHCERSRAELLEVAGSSTASKLLAGVGALCERWDRERVNDEVDGELLRAGSPGAYNPDQERDEKGRWTSGGGGDGGGDKGKGGGSEGGVGKSDGGTGPGGVKETPHGKVIQKPTEELILASHNALEASYHYGGGPPTPGTFGYAANKASVEAFSKEVEKTNDVEKLSAAIHEGWASTAKTFNDPVYKEKPEKQVNRLKLAETPYSKLSEEEKQKDRVVAMALLTEVRPADHWGSKDQPYWRPGPNPTVDNVITRDGKSGKEILLIQRAETNKHGEPVAEGGKWALPGGFHDSDAPKGAAWKAGKETARQAAQRELKEETGFSLAGSMKHVGQYDKNGRDPRDNGEAHALSNAYAVHLTPEQAKASDQVRGTDDAKAAKWIPVSKVSGMALAFDHGKIIKDAAKVTRAGDKVKATKEKAAKVQQKVDAARAKLDGLKGKLKAAKANVEKVKREARSLSRRKNK